MSKLYRISVVGLHLLLLTHIAQSFVLLTANVEDVKKIARKFVSDSLAERITDFIARATRSLAEDKKVSEEMKSKDSSQVSAENRMYNVEKTVNDRLDDIIKTQEAIKVSPRSLSTAKERHKEVELTTSKPKRAVPKPVHGRSRYIEQEKTVETTEKSTTTINVENNDKNWKESIKNIEEINISSSTTVTKAKTKRRYKLLSAVVDKTTATAGIPDDKAKTDGKPSPHPKRSMGEEKAAEAETDNDSYDTDNKYVTEKAVNEYDQYDIERNKNTETEGASAPMSEKDEYDNDINNVIPKHEKAKTRGSLVKEKDFNDGKWWEKELPTNKQHDVDVHTEGKSWF